MRELPYETADVAVDECRERGVPCRVCGKVRTFHNSAECGRCRPAGPSVEAARGMVEAR